MSEYTIKNYAEQIREKIQSLPNYTLTSAKALVEEAGLDLPDSDVPQFMKELLRSPYPPSRKYAYLIFPEIIKDFLTTYAATVCVARSAMVNRIVIERRPRINLMKERVQIKNSEIEIRYYDDDHHLIEGIIYPVPHEEYMQLMILADRWIGELPPPEEIYFENGVLKVPALDKSKSLRKPNEWEVDFYSNQVYLQHTTSSAPRSPYTDLIRSIIEKLLPDVAPYIF